MVHNPFNLVLLYVCLTKSTIIYFLGSHRHTSGESLKDWESSVDYYLWLCPQVAQWGGKFIPSNGNSLVLPCPPVYPMHSKILSVLMLHWSVMIRYLFKHTNLFWVPAAQSWKTSSTTTLTPTHSCSWEVWSINNWGQYCSSSILVRSSFIMTTWSLLSKLPRI